MYGATRHYRAPQLMVRRQRRITSDICVTLLCDGWSWHDVAKIQHLPPNRSNTTCDTMWHVSDITGCFKKSSPPKTFTNIFTSVRSFCVKFCKFVGNLYPHNIYQFLEIYLNILSKGVNFSTSTHRFQPVKFWVGLFTHKMQMQLFGDNVIFS